MVFFLISSIVLGFLDQLIKISTDQDLLTQRITKAFSRYEATVAVALDISKASDSVWHAGLLHKLKSYWISGQIFGLISFLSNRQLQVILDGKSSQEYLVRQGSILGPTLFLWYINDLPDVICDIAIYAMILLSFLSVIRHLIFGNNLNLLRNLNLMYEALWDGGKKWLVDFNAGKYLMLMAGLITKVLLM